VDRFSRFVELVTTERVDAPTTATALFEEWICRHGTPMEIVTDGGSSFANAIIKQTCELLDIQYHITTPYHPESHGAVERANRTVLDMVRSLLRAQPFWPRLLAPVRFAINTSVSRPTGVSPWDAVHGFYARLPLHSALGTVLDFSSSLVIKAAHILEAVRKADAGAFERARATFIKKAKGRRSNEPGEYVLVYFEPHHKLAFAWQGPFLVVEKRNEVIYSVQELNSDRVFSVHLNRLRQFFPGTMDQRRLKLEALHEGEYFVSSTSRLTVRPFYVFNLRASNLSLPLTLVLGSPSPSVRMPRLWLSIVHSITFTLVPPRSL